VARPTGKAEGHVTNDSGRDDDPRALERDGGRDHDETEQRQRRQWTVADQPLGELVAESELFSDPLSTHGLHI
jgi:hypothetical protein